MSSASPQHVIENWQDRDWARKAVSVARPLDRAREAVARARELGVDMAREHRQALDGYLYTAEEFWQYYGEDWEAIWSDRVYFSTRATVVTPPADVPELVADDTNVSQLAANSLRSHPSTRTQVRQKEAERDRIRSDRLGALLDRQSVEYRGVPRQIMLESLTQLAGANMDVDMDLFLNHLAPTDRQPDD